MKSNAKQKSVSSTSAVSWWWQFSIVDFDVDEALIGGAVIRAGDVVIDGSLRSRLEGLANALTA